MELKFNQTLNNEFEAHFMAPNSFNLHVERTDDAPELYIYWRGSSSGEYKLYKKLHGEVIDIDIIIDEVIPKFFKIRSKTDVLHAEVTTRGEMVELSYQEKEVTISKNGTVNVTADPGFTALDSVKVKVNVPTEGGGSSVEADDLLYYMDGTFDWNEGFVVNLNTGELVFSDDYHRDKYSYLYSVDGDTIRIKNPGYMMDYGIVHLPSVEIVKYDQIKTKFPGVVIHAYSSDLPVTKIGKWNFEEL